MSDQPSAHEERNHLLNGDEQPKRFDWFSPSMRVAAGTVSILVFGFAMGLGLPEGDDSTAIPEPWRQISSVLGWIYFAAWSISFYPQTIHNFRRKSVIGLSFDYQLYNIIGFTAYAAFNCSLYWNTSIQATYAEHNDGQASGVRANDVFFALHAVILTSVTITQCFIYERGNQKLSLLAIASSATMIASSALYAILIAAGVGSIFTWFNFLYFLSYLKLYISIVKYVPQVFLNWRLKSTEGWNIWNVLLDFTGGALSVAQQVMDSATTNDWSKISGDPVKFGLGLVSMVFDLIFMVQHYILYRGQRIQLADQLDDDGDTDDAIDAVGKLGRPVGSNRPPHGGKGSMGSGQRYYDMEARTVPSDAAGLDSPMLVPENGQRSQPRPDDAWA